MKSLENKYGVKKYFWRIVVDKASKFEWTLDDIRMEKIIVTQFGQQKFF